MSSVCRLWVDDFRNTTYCPVMAENKDNEGGIGSVLLDRWLDKRGHGSATALAFRLDVTPETISRWRTGRVLPNHNIRRAISNATAGAVKVDSWHKGSEVE